MIVINTVELCEQILSYLSCADLSRARGVCHQFDAVVRRLPLMQQECFLRLRLDPIIWATPADCLLLTGPKAEQHIASAKMKGRQAQELLVYELHPHLTVDHMDHDNHQFNHGIGKKNSQGHRDYYNHKVFIKSFCLASFPLDFSLDDMNICQPPVKAVEICAS
jgi:hypothetical protein